MKVIVLYDSQYGNTQKIATAVAERFGEVAVLRSVSQVKFDEVLKADVLVVASPTQGGRPTKALQAVLNEIPPRRLENHGFAALDTRIAPGEKGFLLRTLMRLIGNAAPKIAATLKARGGRELAPSEGFIVTGKEGPLAEGELERARIWADGLLDRLAQPSHVVEFPGQQASRAARP